ncbi:hypothetical protein MMC09_006568 [Bachmanniomyces sp. S44760]|nr:hypothetical protein [Bachmanniomyces sp. S44760]
MANNFVDIVWPELPTVEQRGRFAHSPKTPIKPLPNSGQKRTGNFSRKDVTPSHHDKMASIFQDAGKSMYQNMTPARSPRNIPLPSSCRGIIGSPSQSLSLPQSPEKQNTAKSRIPISTTSTGDVASPIKSTGREECQETPTPTLDSEDEECHSTHGVPLIIPQRGLAKNTRSVKVASWLEDKENIPPKRSPRIKIHQDVHTPIGLLKLGPRRRQARTTNEQSENRAIQGSSSTPNSPYYDDEEQENLGDLDPHVERYRKYRAPRRDRCPSYFDRDILAFDDKVDDSEGPIGNVNSRPKECTIDQVSEMGRTRDGATESCGQV